MFFKENLQPNDRGLVATGGRLGPEILLEAYAKGIFPWEKRPDIHWYSPDPRMILEPASFHLSHSLARFTRHHPYRLSMDEAFGRVIQACAKAYRPGQGGTWIDPEFIAAYTALHGLGWGHSVEVWSGDELVGGLYGLSIGSVFFGESMFHRARDTSKLAFWALCRHLVGQGMPLIDCQAYTRHLSSLGAKQISRNEYLGRLSVLLKGPSRLGRWKLELGRGNDG